jgi:hypothetical protein
MKRTMLLLSVVGIALVVLGADRVIRVRPTIPAVPLRVSEILYKLDVIPESNPVVHLKITIEPADGSRGNTESYNWSIEEIASWADSKTINGIVFTNRVKPQLLNRIAQAEGAADQFANILQRVNMVDALGVQTNAWMIQP